MGSGDPDSMGSAPKRPFSALSKAFRRTDPTVSVSLRHRKRVKLDQSPRASKNQTDEQSTSDHSSRRANNPSPLAPHESSSDQSATKWFDGVNENVVESGKRPATTEGSITTFPRRAQIANPMQRRNRFSSHNRNLSTRPPMYDRPMVRALDTFTGTTPKMKILGE